MPPSLILTGEKKKTAYTSKQERVRSLKIADIGGKQMNPKKILPFSPFLEDR